MRIIGSLPFSRILSGPSDSWLGLVGWWLGGGGGVSHASSTRAGLVLPFEADFGGIGASNGLFLASTHYRSFYRKLARHPPNARALANFPSLVSEVHVVMLVSFQEGVVRPSWPPTAACDQ